MAHQLAKASIGLAQRDKTFRRHINLQFSKSDRKKNVQHLIMDLCWRAFLSNFTSLTLKNKRYLRIFNNRNFRAWMFRFVRFGFFF